MLLLLLYSHLLLDLLLLHRELLLLLLLLDECLVFHHLLLAVASVLAGVALRRLVTVSLFIGLLDSTELLLPLLEVDTLDFLDLRVDALYFKLVGVNLCLVVLQLSNQVFELLATILKILLVLDQLLCHVGTALLSQNVLQLDVELLFLLDQHIFLRDLLGLCDEALLETLDLLDELVGLNARGLKLAPSVHVQRLLELVLQILSLLLLLKQFLFKQVDLTFQVRDALGLFLGVDKLALVLLDLILLLPDVHDLLLIVDLALLQRRLLDLDLLVQKVKLLVTLDELSGEDISLVHDHLVVLFLLGLLGLSLADDVLEASDIVLLCLDHLFSAGYLLLNLLDLLLELGVLLDVDAALGIFLLLFAVLDDGLLFELANMTGHALEVLLELGDLRVSLK